MEVFFNWLNLREWHLTFPPFILVKVLFLLDKCYYWALNFGFQKFFGKIYTTSQKSFQIKHTLILSKSTFFDSKILLALKQKIDYLRTLNVLTKVGYTYMYIDIYLN